MLDESFTDNIPVVQIVVNLAQEALVKYDSCQFLQKFFVLWWWQPWFVPLFFWVNWSMQALVNATPMGQAPLVLVCNVVQQATPDTLKFTKTQSPYRTVITRISSIPNVSRLLLVINIHTTVFVQRNKLRDMTSLDIVVQDKIKWQVLWWMQHFNTDTNCSTVLYTPIYAPYLGILVYCMYKCIYLA